MMGWGWLACLGLLDVLALDLSHGDQRRSLAGRHVRVHLHINILLLFSSQF